MHIEVDDDYAVLLTDDWDSGFEFYYGYVETTPEGEWCFTVRKDKQELMRLTKTQLSSLSEYPLYGCDEYLLAGIAHYVKENL